MITVTDKKAFGLLLVVLVLGIFLTVKIFSDNGRDSEESNVGLLGAMEHGKIFHRPWARQGESTAPADGSVPLPEGFMEHGKIFHRPWARQGESTAPADGSVPLPEGFMEHGKIFHRPWANKKKEEWNEKDVVTATMKEVIAHGNTKEYKEKVAREDALIDPIVKLYHSGQITRAEASARMKEIRRKHGL